MLSQEQLDYLRNALLEKRAELREEIGNLDADQMVQDTGDQNAGVGNHPAEDALLMDIQEMQVSLRRNHEIILEQVERALERMDKGVYGICENCEKDIGFERLQAIPYTTRCIDCGDESAE